MRNDELVRLKAEIRDLSRQLSWETSKRLELQFEIERIKDVISKCDIGGNVVRNTIEEEDVKPITKEELTATPMNDLRIVSEIRESFPERLTRPPSMFFEMVEKPRVTSEDATRFGYNGKDGFCYINLKDAYNRLADIEDIIYGDNQ